MVNKYQLGIQIKYYNNSTKSENLISLKLNLWNNFENNIIIYLIILKLISTNFTKITKLSI